MDTNEKHLKKVLTQKKEGLGESDSSETGRDLRRLGRAGCTCNPHSQEENHLKNRSNSKIYSCLRPSLSSHSSKEQLEIKILNEEMQEQLSYDKHNTSKKKIQDLSTLIRSLSAYMHSLDLRSKASKRLWRLCRQISQDKAISHQKKDTFFENFSYRIKDVLQKCYRNIELPPNYYIDCNEYSEKYKEHAEATLNYYYLLQRETLSQLEMRDLDFEYDKFCQEFSDSKKSISQQLDSLINQQSEVIQTCVEDLLPLLKEIMEHDRNVYNVLLALSIEVMPDSSESLVSPKALLKNSSKSARRISDSSIRCRRGPSTCYCLEDCENEY